MEENVVLPQNPLPPEEAELVSDPSSHETEPSPNFADLRPVQFSLNGLPETKPNMFDKMDIDNHNVTVDSSTDSGIHKSSSPVQYSSSEPAEIAVSNSSPVDAVSKHQVTDVIDSGPTESISVHSETSPTSCLPVKSVSQNPEITDNHSVPCESVSELGETIDSNSVSNVSISENSEITESKLLPDANAKSVDISPRITPGKSRYGRIRRPKLSVDFVSVDKKSYAVLNSSSYDFEHVDESRSSKTPVPKKKRSYVRKNAVPTEDSQTMPNNIQLKSEQPEESRLTEAGEIKTEFSISTSDVYPLDESSISSLNSNVKTYSRSGNSDERQFGTEDNNSREPIPVNYTELNWKVGDVAWAKVGCYPFWPSIVTLEYGSSIYAKSVGKRGNRLAVHVQFFGDRGRRSWVLTTSLIKYESKEQFLELKRQYIKDKIRFKYFNIVRTKELWEKAIIEADTILKLPHEERIPYYHSIYPISKETYEIEVVKKTPIRRIRKKNPNERRGRKRKILDGHGGQILVKKKKNLENLGSKSASHKGPVLIRRGRGRPRKNLGGSMDEHLRKRRAFEKRLKNIMTQSAVRKAQAKAGTSPKSQKVVNKFDQLVKSEKFGKSANARKEEPQSKDALAVYDFESDEETDVFLGTYNSRFTPHLLNQIEENKDDEGEPTERSTSKAEVDSTEQKVSKVDTDEKAVADMDVDRSMTMEESPSQTNTEVKYKRGRGRPKGSKNAKTLQRLQKIQKMKSRPRRIKTKEKPGFRPKKKSFLLKTEQKMLKKQSSETNDGNDIISEQRKKVHPKKRLLEKSRRSEKILKVVSVEDEEENSTKDKTNPEEIAKPSKQSPSMSPKEDLDEDEDDLKVMRMEVEDMKRRSSSPQPPTYRTKKSCALFSGFKFEKVCLICEKAGDTVRCRGPCSGTYHIECATTGTAPAAKVEEKSVDSVAENVVNVVPCKPRRGRPPRASVVNPVNANESEQAKNAAAGAEEKPSDATVDRSKADDMSSQGHEDNVTKVVEDPASDPPSKDGTSDGSQRKLIASENLLGSDTSAAGATIPDEKTTSAESTPTSVPSPEAQKMNADDCETLPAADFVSSLIKDENSEKKLTPLVNGHCDEVGGGDASAIDRVDANSVNCDTSEKHPTEDFGVNVELEITEEQLEGSVTAEYQSTEAEKCPLVEETPDIDVNDRLKEETCSDNDQTVDKSICSNENSTEQVEEEGALTDSNQTAIDKLEVGSTSCIEVDESVGDSHIEENETNSENKEDVKEPNTSHRVDEEADSCDSMNLQLMNDSETCQAIASNPAESENACDVLKDEKSAVPISLLESEEAGSSDACSENLSCSTKTDSSNGIDFRCTQCVENKQYPCFTCGKDEEEKTGETERYICYSASCGRVYHKECLKDWPQATWKDINSGRLIRNGSSVSRSAAIPKETLLCPQHYCHTCISENPAVHKNRHCNENILVRCIRCPTAYHRRLHCIPAGTEILTMSQIICPRHYEPPAGAKNTVHFNTSWCFICCIGGSLICCDECPTSFHAECLQLKPEEYEGRYICDDCQCGRYLLYGDIAWIKLGQYRWWPAKILYPNEVPENIQQLPHARGEFVVQFFGSHNYNWVNRGRAFLYQEGDSGKKGCGKSAVDVSFKKAIQEAEEAFEKLKLVKAARDEEARLGWKPPKYVHIKANKPVGNVRIVELNTSNITACECDPQSERPCGPDSDCINRMLLVECNPLVCPAGDRCYNQMFEKATYPPLMPFNTNKRGWGLKTLVDMKKGDFIIEYVGEMIDEEEYKRRVNIMHKNQEDNYYFLTIDKDRMLDAGPKGNVARFMNHSCDPNCETQKWTVNGDTRVGLFAVKDIPANTELVFNYNLATQGNEMKPCLCESKKCSGFIGVKAVKNGSLSVEDEQRKRSNEENDGEPSGKKKLKRGKPRKKVRKRVLASKLRNENQPTGIRRLVKKAKIEKRLMQRAPKKVVSRFNKWNLVDARLKNKTPPSRISGGAMKSVESLLKHREFLKQRAAGNIIIEPPAEEVIVEHTPPKEKKIERRGRPKTPKTEAEKQAMLFEMMRRRIQRKIEEMTFCKLDEKCFVCGDAQIEDELLFCDNNKCPKGYHLQCVNLVKWPSGRWLCPWHYCSICKSIRKNHKCDLCTNSYCFLHVLGNLSQEDNGRSICKNHQLSGSENSSASPAPQNELIIEVADICEETPTDTPELENKMIVEITDGTPLATPKPKKVTVVRTADIRNGTPARTTKPTKEKIVGLEDPRNATPESGSVAKRPPTAKRSRGRPKGSMSGPRETSNVVQTKNAVKMAEQNGVVSARCSPSSPAQPIIVKKVVTKKRRVHEERPSEVPPKMAEQNGGVDSPASSSTSPVKLTKLKKKVLTKRRPVREEQPSPAIEEPPRKKLKKKPKKLTNGGDVDAATAGAKKLVVEANVKFDLMSGASKKADERPSEDEQQMDAVAESTTSHANAADSDESFSSYVASEVMIVDEVENTSKELSESSEPDVTAADIETSDDEYDNLEVVVINGEDSN